MVVTVCVGCRERGQREPGSGGAGLGVKEWAWQGSPQTPRDPGQTVSGWYIGLLPEFFPEEKNRRVVQSRGDSTQGVQSHIPTARMLLGATLTLGSFSPSITLGGSQLV